MEKSTLEERERRELELFMEEFKARGGMDDDEIKARIGAIPMEEFMSNYSANSSSLHTTCPVHFFPCVRM